MGSTPFVPIDWVPHEVITKDKMDQSQTNLQWLLDNTPRSRFSPTDVASRDDGNIIVSGRIFMPRHKYDVSGYAHVRFGTTFKASQQIHVTTGIVSDQKKRVWCTVRGINNTISPDSRGFDVQVAVKDISARPVKVKGKTQKDPPDRNIFVMWQATGIRRTF